MNIKRSLLVKMVLTFVSIMLSAMVIISAFTYYGNVEILKNMPLKTMTRNCMLYLKNRFLS